MTWIALQSFRMANTRQTKAKHECYEIHRGIPLTTGIFWRSKLREKRRFAFAGTGDKVVGSPKQKCSAVHSCRCRDFLPIGEKWPRRTAAASLRTKEIARSREGRWLINHFVVIIAAPACNFDGNYAAAYFILIILLCPLSHARRSSGARSEEERRRREEAKTR